MRRPLIAGNWKMNLTPSEALAMVRALKEMEPWPKDVDGAIFPPFPSLYPLYEELKDFPLALGAQTMSYEEPGAFTGDVSWDMLKDVGVTYVLVGHSERRRYYHENNLEIQKILRKALDHELRPVLCVGESLKERQEGRHKQKVEGQLHRVLKDLRPEEMAKVTIAYEPVWAIGTGKTASAGDAEEIAGGIRRWMTNFFGEEVANTVRILYGGSVKPGNIKEILGEENIDGALVGGASLKAEDFFALLNGGKR